jgi:gamma-glutamylcyclotransferase (GGCT)/AIG2-like uncharacterized protein YtfP
VTVVFVYGTLTEPTRVSELLTAYTFGPSAICHGLQRVDGRYPTLVPGGQVSGRLLSTTELDRLDRYEGVDRGLYCRLSVPLARSVTAADESATESAFDVDTAAVYVGEPTGLGVDGVEWPGSGPFAQRVDEYIDRENVRIETGSHGKRKPDDH